MKNILLFLIFICTCSFLYAQKSNWIIDSEEEWAKAKSVGENIIFEKGSIKAENEQAYYSSHIQSFSSKRKAKAITFKQPPLWDNWEAIPKVTPEGASDAPVFLPVADGDYWFFAKKRGSGVMYHAWHSTDMKNWQHYTAVSPNWMTTAEYVNGKFYLYYDKPNDEDPHLVIYNNVEALKAGEGKDMGMVLNDPSHGSDAAVFRDEDGIFHIIYEDWNPINARENSWDSPLAGHVSSPDGINGFTVGKHVPAIDVRSKPTGKFDTYIHGTTHDTYTYEIHEGPQDAFGDWTCIKVGSQYYLFCDYDSHDHNKSMRIGRWTSSNINEAFSWDGEISEKIHPDPTIGFAEGKFFLIVQRSDKDFISSGPWVEEVQARVGVDVNGNGEINKWTDWQIITETYSQKKGFARVVETVPAQVDLSALPAGKGFKFELKMKDMTKNKSIPAVDKMTLSFEPL